MSNKEDFKDFEAMKEKTDFLPNNTCHFPEWIESYFKKAYSDFILISVPLQLYRKMAGILHCNTHINTLSNLNNTWDCLVFVWKKKICTVFTTNSIDLTWIFDWFNRCTCKWWWERGQATASNVEGSDRWQIIDLERSRSTTQLARNSKFL